jgi:hypothetical protein
MELIAHMPVITPQNGAEFPLSNADSRAPDGHEICALFLMKFYLNRRSLPAGRAPVALTYCTTNKLREPGPSMRGRERREGDR